MEHVGTESLDTVWAERGQPWRTEQEISPERQSELAARRAVTPDAVRGEYPFKGVRLDRADIEWLLSTHEGGRGPVDPTDASQGDRVGLDLRGADLSYAKLSNLPLARTGRDPSGPRQMELNEQQRRMVATDLRGADLSGAQLQDSRLDYANLMRANLRGCRLDGASMWGVNLKEADCDGAHLEGADLWNAHLEGAYLYRAHLQRARLHEAYLAGVHFTDLNLTDEDGVGPFVADIHWEGVNLSVVNWSEIRILGDDLQAVPREAGGTARQQELRFRLFSSAARANQQLALALQAQGMTDDANRFFYRSRVLQRKLLGRYGGRRPGPYLASLLLEGLTGYGYRMGRMIVAYIALVALFAALYYHFGHTGAAHLGVREAVVLSITSFHGRVFSSPFTVTDPQSVIAAVEAVTGFLFEGLFIAMLAQRVFGR